MTVYLLVKGNNDKTYWNRQGVVFQPNNDGSRNMKLDMFPGLTFQIRDDKEQQLDRSPEYNQEAKNGRR